MADETEEWIPLRQAVADITAIYVESIGCERAVAVEFALQAIIRRLWQGSCKSQAKDWFFVALRGNRQKNVGSSKIGPTIPHSIWQYFSEFGHNSSASKILKDFTCGEFIFQGKMNNGLTDLYITISGVEVDKMGLPLIGDSQAFTAFGSDYLQFRERERRGAPRKWDWEGAICEIVARANTPDGLPLGHGAQAEIGRMMVEWFRHNQNGEPAPSEIGARAAKIMKVIDSSRK